MQALKDRILTEGIAKSSGLLKVSSINDIVDPKLMKLIGEDFANHFRDKNITRVGTIATSGIYPATYTAEALGVPIFALKKQPSGTLNADYTTIVHSYTHDEDYHLVASKSQLKSGERILFIDDFLAMGEAATGFFTLADLAGTTVIGAGFVIEKSFQPGREILNTMGVEVYSQARVKSLSDGKITFLK